MLDAERPTLFIVLLRLLPMDVLFRFLPFFEDLPITRVTILFMDLYVFRALFLNGVNIY